MSATQMFLHCREFYGEGLKMAEWFAVRGYERVPFMVWYGMVW